MEKRRRSLEIDENEKRTTAYHESGHAIVGLIVKHADPSRQSDDHSSRHVTWARPCSCPRKIASAIGKMSCIDQLGRLMGGRSPKRSSSAISPAALSRISNAPPQLARSMVCEWGMSGKLGAVAYDDRSENGQYLGMNGYSEKKYSEETAREIDDEVRRILDEANDKAKKIISENKDKVELLTEMLIKFETLSAEDVQKILKNEWSIEDKEQRLKQAEDLHKKAPATPPPLPPEATAKPASSPT